ncbi:MAG: aminopeptidase [Candidatus Caldatribacteriota bacterium]
MIITEIFRNMWKPLKYNIKKGENILILTDPLVESEIIKCLFSALLALETHPTLMIIPALRVNEELSPSVAVAIKEADLLIAATSKPISRTKAVQEGRNKGVKYLAMAGITIESLLKGAITADFEELHQLTRKFANILSYGNNVYIKSKIGTDLTFSIQGRKVIALDGRIDEVSRSAGIPSGEAACSPVEGTAEGIVVIDGGIHEIGLIQEPVILRIEKGKVIEINGGTEAHQLRELLANSGDSNSYNLAEFAFGTNPAAVISPNIQEFKNKLGTVHLALGNNKNLFGNIFSKIHLDAIIMKPTVEVDNRVVLKDGIPVD